MSSVLESNITAFVNRQVSYMQSLDAEGLRPLRIWNKLLSKPKLDENGIQILGEDGRPERELICDHNGEVIDDSSYILSTSEALAKAFSKLSASLSGTKQYASLELLDPMQVSLKDSEIDGDMRYIRFNIIKASFNESAKTWELYTVRHKVAKALSLSQCMRPVEQEVESDDIDI